MTDHSGGARQLVEVSALPPKDRAAVDDFLAGLPRPRPRFTWKLLRQYRYRSAPAAR